jgi:spoIIIJ-associated protein
MVDNTTMEFQGKDIADAISKACKALKVSQEDLDIEVLTTGTTGIFGLMKQKATLSVSLKKELQDKPERKKKREKRPAKRQEQPAAAKEEETGKAAEPEVQEPAPPPPREKEAADVSVPASDELLEQAKKDLDHILELMGCPSEVTVSSDINAVDIQIQGEYVKEITNQNGKILDSLQYLLRKIISQKFPEKATISIDADNFREKRIEELKELGLKLAEEAKNTGKTRSISSLNPSERRIVHVALQDDKDIRSRSVGDGLFKKVLIYKPGSKNKKSSSRRRRGPRKPNNK